MNIKLELFGPLSEITKLNSFDADQYPDTDTFLFYLCNEFPALKSSTFIIAVNNNIINQNTSLSEDSVVALMPAYSGG